MQKNAALVLAFGFIFGLGLASCATSESSRRVAGDKRTIRGSNDDVAFDRECFTGEERDASGQCVRVQHIERPARRGGR